MIGYAFCGSFCTLSASLAAMEGLVSSGCEILPIVSENVYKIDTRFFTARDFINEVKRITGKEPIHTITGAEPLGPSVRLECLVISPCTGNTLAKLAAGITDTPVCMAAKAHLRCDRPLLIALSSNDALAVNLKNIASLIEKKNVYFVPMRQDDPKSKPHSLSADFAMLPSALAAALDGKQISEVFI